MSARPVDAILNVLRLLTRPILALCVLLGPLAQAAAATAATAPAAEPRFDLLAFVVAGDRVLGAAAIERIVYPFLGPQRSAADAEAARKALEQAYQSAGFLAVNVVLPPQQIDASGELRLEVLSGQVDKLRVTGAQHTRPARVREALPSVAAGSVPNLPELQDELLQLAQAGGQREVTPLIAAGDKPGTMAVELKVQDSLPLSASVELNNRQSPDTRAGRLAVDLSADDLFQRGHALSLNWLVSPRAREEADIVSLLWQMPVRALGNPGDRLTVGWTHSSSSAFTALAGNTISRGDTWRLRLRHGLRAPEGLNHGLSLGLNFYDLQDRTLVNGLPTGQPASLRYPAFQAEYDLSWLPRPGATERSTRLQLQFTGSLPGLSRRTVDCDGNGSLREQFDCKRSGARPQFQTLGLSLQHREPLGRGFALLRLQGQYSDAPLVSGEQAAYGGPDTVRGYQDGQISGDLGGAVRVELGAPPWQPWAAWRVQGLVFVDAAHVRRQAALPGEEASSRLAATGLGLQIDAPLGLQASLSWARLLVDRGARHGQQVDLALRQRF